MNDLKFVLRQWTIFLGVLQVTVGCLVGLIPSSAVQWFRGLVMAHIEFTANGVLIIVLALILKEVNLGPKALKTWFTTLQLGTWTNGLSGLLAAVLGQSSTLLPTLNEKFPPPNGTQQPVVTALLMFCAVSILTTLVLTLVGLWRNFHRP